MKSRTLPVLPGRMRQALLVFTSFTLLQISAQAQLPTAGTLLNLKTVESNIDPRGVAITPDGTKAVMAEWENTRVRIINMSDLTSTFVATEARPDDVVIDASGTYAYVDNVASNSISRIKLSDGTSTTAYISSVSSTGSPRAVDITPDGNTLIVACDNTTDAGAELVFIDLTNATILGRVAVTNGARRLVVHPDGTSVFTYGWSTSGTVTEVSVASRSIVGSYNYGATDGAIKALGFNKGATVMYTAHNNGNVAAYSNYRSTPSQDWSASLIPTGLDADWANCYAFDPNYDRLYLVTHNTSGAANLLVTVDLATHTRLSDVGASTWPNSIGISSNGRAMMLSLRRNNQARYYSVAPYYGGSGTSGSPYQITTWTHLNNIRDNPTAYFQLMNNLDNTTSGYANFAGTLANSNTGWLPLGDNTTNFNGSFDGGGYTISSLTASRTGYNYNGLFGYVGASGLVKSTRLVSPSVAGNNFTAALAGYNAGTVQDCYASSVTVSGTSNAGGLVGWNIGTITRSYTSGSVTGSGIGAGGLAGTSSAGTISNAYSLASVTGNTYGGGLVGRITGGSVQSCYSTGSVAASTKGGLAGYLASATVTNCFWDTQASGISTSAAGTGKTTAEMGTYQTFLDNQWDLQCERLNGSADVWMVNNAYPTLTSFGNTMSCPVWTATSSNDITSSANWQSGQQALQGMDFSIGSSATSDLVLGQAWTAGNITFNTAGVKIVLGNNDFKVLGAVTGANASNYFQTNGTGQLRNTVTNAGSVTFHVGRASYCPVTIANNTGSDDILSVRVRDEVLWYGTSGPNDPGNYITHSWDIDKANANSGSGLNFIFNWNAGETHGTVNVPKLFHYNSSTSLWEKQTGTTSYTSTSLTYSGYTGTFSPFAIADNQTVLPVSWTSFTGQCNGNSVQLQWSTANESNNSYFQVEKSSDLRNWAIIGKVQGAGNSSTGHDYSFTDAATGTAYYRIRQVDYNGKESISATIASRCGSDPAVKVTVSSLKQISVNGLAQPTAYQLVDGRGALLRSGTLLTNINTIDLSSLPAGIYYLKMNGSQTHEAHKIVLYQ